MFQRTIAIGSSDSGGNIEKVAEYTFTKTTPQYYTDTQTTDIPVDIGNIFITHGLPDSSNSKDCCIKIKDNSGNIIVDYTDPTAQGSYEAIDLTGDTVVVKFSAGPIGTKLMLSVYKI